MSEQKLESGLDFSACLEIRLFVVVKICAGELLIILGLEVGISFLIHDICDVDLLSSKEIDVSKLKAALRLPRSEEKLSDSGGYCSVSLGCSSLTSGLISSSNEKFGASVKALLLSSSMELMSAILSLFVERGVN